MKILKVIFTVIIFFAFIIGLFVSILYWKANTEKKPLTDADRKSTSGQYVRLSQGVTHYQLAGPDTGKVVILVHGFSVPYYIWDGTFEYLVKQGFRVLRYDLYGRGYSDRPDVVYDKLLYQKQLADLIQALHLTRPVNLAGVSFGCGVVTDFTCVHPDLVSKVILIDPVYPFGHKPVPQFYALYDEAIHPDDRINSQAGDFKYPGRHPGWATKYKVQMQYKGFRNALVSTRYQYHYKARESNACLNSTHKPVLLIWGKDDHTVPFNYSDSIRSVLKCEFFPVDDAAHLPNIEQASPVNSKMAAFINEK